MKEKKINCEMANGIDLIEVLKHCNLLPLKETNNDAWYLSPFRAESTPSFKVSKKLNKWYDHGEGIGGGVVDFIVKLNNCSIKDALRALTNNSFSFHKHQSSGRILNNYEIKNIDKIQNLALINYLNHRKIDVSIAQNYCNEIHYSFDGLKTYFGIGFRNDSGGFEIRNKYFKGCLGSKSVSSFIKGSETVCLFESFSDFLSYIVLNKSNLREDYIVLNSIALVKRAIVLLQNYNAVKTFFDNDTSGKLTTIKIKNSCKNEFQDCSNGYKDHKDLNEYLMNLIA